MVPFVIVADLRTGSTLLASSLDRHPQVHCYGELFHPEDLPDNRIEGLDRCNASAGSILRHAFHGAGARGFKAMAFLPLAPRWQDAWERLHDVAGVHVLWLTRRDRLAQYASLEVARHTGVFHPFDDDGLYRSENRPTITVDPAVFLAWQAERDALLCKRRKQLDGLPALELDYERLTGEWQQSTEQVQEFLGVDVEELQPNKRKQEPRPLSEVIANYDEIAAELASS